MSKFKTMPTNRKILFLLVLLGYGGLMFGAGFLTAMLIDAFEFLFYNYIPIELPTSQPPTI